MEEVEAGLVHDPEEVYTDCQDPAHDPWSTLVAPVLRQMRCQAVIERTGLDRSTLTRLCNGHMRPRPAHRAMLIRAAGDFARAQLEAARMSALRKDLAACAAWLTKSGQ